jgi:hypothetical protein
MRGFYVTRIKKDQRTGHYVGVATWFPRDQPLPSSRIAPLQPESPKMNEEVQEHLVPLNTPFSADNPERVVHDQVEDSRSEFNQTVERFNVQRRPSRNSVYDPYDSYEL